MLNLLRKQSKIRNLARFFATKRMVLPKFADSVEEITLVRYLVEPGDYVFEDDDIIEVESQKGETAIKSSLSGMVSSFLFEPMDDFNVGDEYCEIDVDAPVPEKKPKEISTPSEPVKATETPAQVKSETVKTPSKETVKTPVASPILETRGEVHQKISRLRKTVAKRLKESQNTYAQVCTFQEIDMSNIMTMRMDLGDQFVKAHGVKLGFMSFFIKACAIALEERPIVNSVIDAQGENVISRNYVDISVAVSGPNGLLVPVLRDLEHKGFGEIEKNLMDVAQKAKEGKLSLEEMEGGNFTISNGGVFGSMLSVPIINPPQSAIMGMHNIVTRPVVRDGQIVARPIMYVSLSYDHRLLDGREGAGFLKRVADLLEDPRKMMLGGA